MNMRNQKTFTVALGGISLALTVVCLYVASFVPGFELTLYAVSSFFVVAMVIETKPLGGLLLVLGGCILGFLLIPNKLGILPYAFFFGIYPIGKYYAEKPRRAAVQLSIKIACFLVIFVSAFLFFKGLFFGSIQLPDHSPWILLAGGVVMFVLYDYILTLFIRFYHRRIKRDEKEIKLS